MPILVSSYSLINKLFFQKHQYYANQMILKLRNNLLFFVEIKNKKKTFPQKTKTWFFIHEIFLRYQIFKIPRV